MAILDTNVIIRHLAGDNPALSQRALAFFQEIEAGRRRVTLPEGVLCEVAFALSSPRMYNVDRVTIRTRLLSILRLPHLQMANKRVYLRALDLFVEYSRLSFVDALCIAYAERSEDKTVISFDRDFRNLPDLVWEQP